MFSELSTQTKAKVIARQYWLQCYHQAVGGFSVTFNYCWPDTTRCCLGPLLIAIIVFVCVSAFGKTAVEGRVELPKSHSAPVMANRYEIVTRGSVLSTQPPLAVVYLDGSFPKPNSNPTKQIAQKDLAFLPSLLPVQVGTRIEFPNFDDTYHSIFSYSPAKRFDVGRYRPDERPIPSEVFDTPGLVTLRCDIHEHMRGLILVLNTPYFDGRWGRFRLSGLPSVTTRSRWIDSRTTRTRRGTNAAKRCTLIFHELSGRGAQM